MAHQAAQGTGAAARRSALKIAGTYACVGVLWILMSDLVVNRLFGPAATMQWAQTGKGILFVLVTASLVYYLANRTICSIRKSEEARRETQRLLATLLGNLPGMAYRCLAGTECTLEFASGGSLSLTGYSPLELLQKKNLAHLIVEADRDHVKAKIDAAIESRDPFRLAYRIHAAGGDEKWVWDQGVGIYSEAGELVALEGFISDITEHRLVEEAFKKSQAVYRAVVESTSDAIQIVNANREFIAVNRAFEKLFGYTGEDIIGKSARTIHPSDESFVEFGKKAYPVFTGQAPLRTEWKMMKKGGTVFPIEGTYSAIRAPDGSIAGFVGIVRDITERKETERELKEYREHLEQIVRERTRQLEEAQRLLVQKEKLKTLGAITAEVAHTFRNPLVSIGGFARRLRKKYPDSSEAEIILEESGRLEAMLGRISRYLRPVEIQPRECFVNAIITESLGLLFPEMETERVKVGLDLDPDLPPAYVDPDVLGQVFINVIRNAVSMMDIDKQIAIRSYDSGENICVDFRNPVRNDKLRDAELLLTPFYGDENEEGNAVSESFKLLRGMAGGLFLTTERGQAILSIRLMKTICRTRDYELEEEGGQAAQAG